MHKKLNEIKTGQEFEFYMALEMRSSGNQVQKIPALTRVNLFVMPWEHTLTISSSSSQIEFTGESCPLFLGELAPGTIAGSESQTHRNCKEKTSPRPLI